MQLSRDQINSILKNAPAGTDKTKILDGLVQRGYELEGVDTQAAKQQIQAKAEPIAKKQSVLGEAFGDVKQVGEDIVKGTDKTTERIADSRRARLMGEQGMGETLFQQAGALAQGGANAIAAVFKGGANLLLKDEDEKKVTAALQKFGGQVMEIPGVKEGVQKIIADYNSLDPKTRRNVDAAGGIVALVSNFVGGEAASAAKNTVKEVAETGFNAAKQTFKEGVEGFAENVAKNSSSYPRQLVDNLTDFVTKIDPQTKNVLKTTNIEKFNNYVKIGEEALNDPRVLTPLERAGEKVNDQILPTMKEDLRNIGSQKAKTLQSVATQKMPEAATDVIKFVREKTQALKLTKEERNLVESLVSELEKLGKNPTLGSADKTVDLLQNTLFEKTRGLAIPVTSRVEGIVNTAIGKLNTAVKDISKKVLGSDEYVVLNDAYKTKIELFNKLNKAIGEDAAKGGSLFKRFFSPQDSGTKKLFAELKEVYGIDLAEDATLAKFVMDSLGDTRSKSLLEQVPLSKGGIVNKVLQKAEEKLTRPIDKARRIIESRSPKGSGQVKSQLQSSLPKKVTSSSSKVKDFIKNPKMGLSIEDVTKTLKDKISSFQKGNLTEKDLANSLKKAFPGKDGMVLEGIASQAKALQESGESVAEFIKNHPKLNG